MVCDWTIQAQSVYLDDHVFLLQFPYTGCWRVLVTHPLHIKAVAVTTKDVDGRLKINDNLDLHIPRLFIKMKSFFLFKKDVLNEGMTKLRSYVLLPLCRGLM